MRFVHTLLIIILICLPPAELRAADGKLMTDCIIQLKGVNGGQTRVTVMPGNALAYVLTPSKLHFVLDLPLNETYLLTFEHPDCVTKQIYVDASVPAFKRTHDFDFPMQVTLEHHEDPFIYAGPVGFIYYEAGITDFSFHTDYAMEIDKRFEERMIELERTGIDPQAALLSATTTTTPAPEPRAATPRDTTRVPTWGTVARTVPHVAPMVHRVIRPEEPEPEPIAATAPKAEAPPAPEPKRTAPKAPEPAPTPLPVPAPSAVPPAKVDVTDNEEPTTDRYATEVALQAATWELVMEDRSVTTIIRLLDQNGSTEYRRVLHISGAAYYFKDGRSISAHSYEQGTRRVRAMDARLDGEGANNQ